MIDLILFRSPPPAFDLFYTTSVMVPHYLDNTAVAMKTPSVRLFGLETWTGSCTSVFSPKLHPGETHELIQLGCDIPEFYAKLNNHGCQEGRVQPSNPCKT